MNSLRNFPLLVVLSPFIPFQSVLLNQRLHFWGVCLNVFLFVNINNNYFCLRPFVVFIYLFLSNVFIKYIYHIKHSLMFCRSIR